MSTKLRVLLGLYALLAAFRAVWTAGGLLGSLYTGQDWQPWLTSTVDHAAVAGVACVAFSLACREVKP